MAKARLRITARLGTLEARQRCNTSAGLIDLLSSTDTTNAVVGVENWLPKHQDEELVTYFDVKITDDLEWRVLHKDGSSQLLTDEVIDKMGIPKCHALTAYRWQTVTVVPGAIKE